LSFCLFSARLCVCSGLDHYCREGWRRRSSLSASRRRPSLCLAPPRLEHAVTDRISPPWRRAPVSHCYVRSCRLPCRASVAMGAAGRVHSRLCKNRRRFKLSRNSQMAQASVAAEEGGQRKLFTITKFTGESDRLSYNRSAQLCAGTVFWSHLRENLKCAASGTLLHFPLHSLCARFIGLSELFCSCKLCTKLVSSECSDCMARMESQKEYASFISLQHAPPFSVGKRVALSI
jgi:hypothetical protein